MKQFILGTAGHIDHGKTSLVKTLTGISTDRLKEEQLRGITIELGFASLDLPGNYSLSIIDVPGHEKFVKTMVAGATGIDILILTIAADEGIMPQTREHLDICSLLNIKYGIIALTKIDLVEEEWIELVKEDIRIFTDKTFLENSPIIPVSSLTGQGTDKLVLVLNDLCNSIPNRSSFDIFRLPVDRVFTMKGFGTVTTGTLISGSLSIGDSVMLYPSQSKAKVRGIQIHSKNTETAIAGMRTAINFQGLKRNEIKRGDVIANENSLSISYMLDLLLTFLKRNKKPLKNRTKIRFHTGTSEVMGNIILLDRDELQPGEKCLAQVRLEAPLALVKGDRFVMRSCSPVQTIAGGEILNPIPNKWNRFDHKILSGLQILTRGSTNEIVDYHIESSGSIGITLDKLLITTNISKKKLKHTLHLKVSKKEIRKIHKNRCIYVHENTFKTIVKSITKILSDYHNKYPTKIGISKEVLKSYLHSNISNNFFNYILDRMLKSNKILIEKNFIKSPYHKVVLKIDQEKIKEQIIKIYKKERLTPPYFVNIIKNLNVNLEEAKLILDILLREKILVKIKEELYCHKDVMKCLKGELIHFLNKNEEITTSQFKNIAKASRKYAIPLIEYFDSIKVTIRIGDIRKLRNQRQLTSKI